MNEISRSESYAAAGVDITAGYRAVELMKQHVARTMIPGVVTAIGGFGGPVRAGPDGHSEARCWSPAPTAWAPS